MRDTPCALLSHHRKRSRPPTSCTLPPRFSLWQGIYNILYQEEGDASSCEVEIQSLECHTACPGEQCGRSYMQAVGIKAQGRAVTHDIILHGANCTLDGTICGTTNGQNVGTDGVKIIPYTPVEGLNPYMGEYGPGLYGWYIYAGGYAINVTMTKPTEDTFAMNLIAHTPPMCTAGASGLCMESNTTKDETIKMFAADYARRSALAVLKSTAKSSRIQKALSVRYMPRPLQSHTPRSEPASKGVAASMLRVLRTPAALQTPPPPLPLRGYWPADASLGATPNAAGARARGDVPAAAVVPRGHLRAGHLDERPGGSHVPVSAANSEL